MKEDVDKKEGNSPSTRIQKLQQLRLEQTTNDGKSIEGEEGDKPVV
jgi:hypothetical protein